MEKNKLLLEEMQKQFINNDLLQSMMGGNEVNPKTGS
jgi:hypothetical protein